MKWFHHGLIEQKITQKLLLLSLSSITFSLRGAETGGEAGCWSVPLEAFVMPRINTKVHGNNYENKEWALFISASN